MALTLVLLPLHARGAQEAGQQSEDASPDTSTFIASPESPSDEALGATSGASESSTELLGWARAALSYDFPRDAPTQNPLDPQTPHDALTDRSMLYLRFHHRRGDGLSFVASGALEHRIRWRDLPEALPGQETGKAWRYQLEPRLQELYVGIYKAPLDLTIGQQRIAWGRNEILAINDVINPQDLRDPLLIPEELRYKPGIAVRADIALGASSLQLIVVPFFQPHDFEFYGSNWALVQDSAPAAYRAVLQQVGESPAGSALFSGERGVSAGLSQAAAGLRFAWRLGNVEVTHYYHQGFDYTPRWNVDSEQLAALLDPALINDPVARTLAFTRFSETVSVNYQRRHHVGLSLVGEAGPLILYGEGAFESRKVFITQALTTVVHPWATALVGVEYQHEFDQVIDVALSYGRVLPRDGAPPPLLWNERDTLGSAITLRWGLTEEVSLEGQGGVGVIPFGVSGRVGVHWKREHLSFRAGALIMTGEKFSYGGYFRANQGIFLDLRYIL
ncbi:hypothetical protein [Hyalangium minutum]|uniref:Uncharacterized protein n=1 Tax=Hyalangium minutum TaxID=394096 RepID=A0A085WP96_9BACT|nr:hypothetical protein [Hyalangium minutum]KFE69509.1 hypothetical protein DB31_6484 [Hyalangium minutum]